MELNKIFKAHYPGEKIFDHVTGKCIVTADETGYFTSESAIEGISKDAMERIEKIFPQYVSFTIEAIDEEIGELYTGAYFEMYNEKGKLVYADGGAGGIGYIDVFYKAGTYTIKVYNATPTEEHFLASETVEIGTHTQTVTISIIPELPPDDGEEDDD